MALDKTDIAEIISGFETDIENEKIHLSDAMNPLFNCDERESYLEDAYLCHLKVNRGAKIINRKIFDTHIQEVLNKEYEELKVLSYEEYISI